MTNHLIYPSTDVADRVGTLVRLLGSPNDGEALGAARALGRVLEGAHLDFHDLAHGVVTAPAHTQPEDHWSGWHWRSTVEWCQARSEYLNDWEQNFVNDLARRRYSTLSEKQAACLERIRQKILGPTIDLDAARRVPRGRTSEPQPRTCETST
ncbi:MAG TPA: hypothetical protein VF913_12410 [Xanthobacteraceae bacterium]